MPSPAWPQPAIHDWFAVASSLTFAMNSGIDARGTTTSKMSSASLAFATQNAFSRASMSCARGGRGQHVHVDRAQLRAAARRATRHVLVEPVLVAVLHHDDEVRECRRPGSPCGMPRSRPDVRGDGRQRHHVDVLEDQRPDAAVDDARDRGGDLVERRERREHRRLVAQPRVELERRLGDEGERAFGADDQLRQVVARSSPSRTCRRCG